jgi:hypothetical protein
MRRAQRSIFLFSLVVLLWSSSITVGRAQPNPTVILGEMISAFQNCGPPQAYQMLAPQLFQIISLQTGNAGCYPQIRAAGPVQNMQIIGQQMFPIGPLYIIRVQHPSVTVDWFIGLNQFTGQIQFLTFQPAAATMPTIATGPTPSGGGSAQSAPAPAPSAPTQSAPTPAPSTCSLYAGMC